ncbi:phage virion morphogenesis protein [uncultured Thiodictyon sp.]|uniref:phage virion morphogenesis protein n=1 Tax=uncultured Thiodictyon sp. TaxID=1846217 RepID=UPI0025E7FF88|nr:phage virion morphogenesis protein [uncultured Thiodictyon sp.]
MINITVQDQQVTDYLNRLLHQLGDLSPAMAGIATELGAAVSGRFETKTDPAGNAWAAWKPSTEQNYPAAGNRTLLDRYGDMLDSLNSSATADTATIGFGVPYAAYHEWGTEHMARRGLLSADPDAGTLGAEDTQRVLDILTRLLNPAA